MSIAYNSNNNINSNNNGCSMMMALPVELLLKHIRREAEEAERKAQELTLQADRLCEEHGISPEIEASYQVHEEELAPLDPLTGKPKYKGRKRGRKPKPRLRKHNKSRGKRKHTAYTLFVKENYPPIRQMHPEYPSKHIISIVARQWASIGEAEKMVWKERAQETHHADEEDDDEIQEATADGVAEGAHDDHIVATATTDTGGEEIEQAASGQPSDSDGENQSEVAATRDHEGAQSPKSPSKRQKRSRSLRGLRKGGA